MTRDECVKAVMDFAAKLAEEYGCDEMTVGEDKQKGIWGEAFTAFLEEKYGGDCSTEIVWEGGERDESKKYSCDKPERKVQFHFRFASPCVSVALDHRATFAELEFSDWNDKESTGNYKLHEVHAWGDSGGLLLLDHVMSAWDLMREESER